MKTFFLFLLLILEPVHLFSQVFVEKCFEPTFNSTFNAVAKDSMGNFYITGNSGFGWGCPAWITKINSSGTILFHKPEAFSDDTYFNGIIETDDNNFLICGFAMGCDWFPSQFGIIAKYSDQGNRIWMKILNPDSSFNTADNYLFGLIELPNHCITIHSDSTLFYLNEFGDSIWSIVLPGNIKSLCNYGNNILAGNNSDLLVIDTFGNVLNQVPFPGVIEYTRKISNSKYLVKANNFLYVLDSMLVIINQVDLTSINFDADLITFDSNLICIGNSQGSDFACFDHFLSLTDSFRIQTAIVNCNAMSIHDTTLFIFGNESAKNNYQYYKSVSVNGNFHFHNVDLALTRVSFDTTYANHPYQLPNGVFAITFVAKLTVTNYGTEIINSFNVNATSYLPGPCGPGTFIQRFNNINLLPGDSMQVTLDTLGEWGIVISEPYNYTYTFCPWVSCADSITDKDHSNDFLCDSFMINEIVSVEELFDEKMLLYPNPIIDVLNFKNNLKGSQKYVYTILNSLSEVIESGILISGTINTDKLKSGIYFLIIESEGRKSVNKFIKIK